MGFVQAVRTCLSKFLHLQGRAGRAEYWWFFLFVVIATIAAQAVDSLIFGAGNIETAGHHPVTLLTSFVLFFPTLSAGWRRMHDTGHPGWYVLAPQLIVMAGLAAFMIGVLGFGIVEGATGESERLRGVAGVIGTAGLALVWAAVVAALAIKFWWLTRPGDAAANAYGPPPA